jgi:protein-tyrosine phosphatase
MDRYCKSVLFVCLGNICRSPTGEGIFRHYVLQRDCDAEIVIDSAGTIDYHHGKPADARMRNAAANRGYDLQSRSRKITSVDLETFDLVIAMDVDNFQDIQSLHPEATASVKMLSDFLDDQWPVSVPDPYYGGDEGFEYVIDMIEAAMPNLYTHLTSL